MNQMVSIIYNNIHYIHHIHYTHVFMGISLFTLLIKNNFTIIPMLQKIDDNEDNEDNEDYNFINNKMNKNQDQLNKKDILYDENHKEIGNIDNKSLIVGLLLGNGQLNYWFKTNRTQLVVAHDHRYKEYSNYLHSLLYKSKYCSSEPPQYKKDFNYNIKKPNLEEDQKDKLGWYKCRYYIYSYFLDYFTIFYKIFYQYGKKIIPINIEELLTPSALAIFIMDNSTSQKSGLLLHTNEFTKSDVQLLREILFDKYGLITNLRTSLNKDSGLYQYNIYFVAESIHDLINIIKPYLHPSMYKKFGKYSNFITKH